MAIDLGQVLQLQGGSPQLKAGTIFAEKLKMMKALDTGGLGSLLSGILANGLSSIMQNPAGAATSQLQAAMSSAVSALNAIGAGSSAAAITGASGLASAVSTFASVASGLSGAGPVPPDGFGLIDLITHANTVDILGPNPPQQYSSATAAAPLTSNAVLQGATSALGAIPGQITAATLTDNAAAAQIMAIAANLNLIVSNSTAAIGNFRALLPTLATASAVGAAVAQASSVSPGDATLASLLPQIIQSGPYAALQAAGQAMIAAPDATITTVAPLIDRASAVMKRLLGLGS